MYDNLDYEVTDPIATITLRRPDQLNALTGDMLRELTQAMAAAENDERAVAILLTGAGRGFCAGADLNGLKSTADAGGRSESGNLKKLPRHRVIRPWATTSPSATPIY